jgi:glutamate-1-semialdehyde 2,1-aminomutase
VIQKVQKDRPDLKMHFRRVNSIFWFCFDVESIPQGPDDIKPPSAAAYKSHYHKLLEGGVYLAPSAYEVGFLSIAHTKQDLDKLASAIRGL